jgi:hypothetical protein
MNNRPNRTQTLRKAFIATVTTAGAIVAVGCFGATSNPPFASCPAEEPSGLECGGDEAGASCFYQDGCGNDIGYSCDEGAWTVTSEASCNPPPPECPATQPADGDSCDQLGTSCPYPDDFCGIEINAECTDAGWSVEDILCNPPPAECPIDEPDIGEPCEEQSGTFDGYPSYCEYEVDTPCGVQPAALGCEQSQLTSEYSWAVVVAPSCAAPPEQCQEYNSAGLCEADAGCAWRAPGCAEGGGTPNVEAGCYPAEDCSTSGCGTWGTCTEVTFDPCWNSLCGACAAETNVCIAS